MKTISIRCHETDIKIIQEACEKRGITTSELMRDLVRKEKRKDETMALLHSIKSDVTNLKDKGVPEEKLNKMLHYLLVSSAQIDEFIRDSLGHQKYNDLAVRVKARTGNGK